MVYGLYRALPGEPGFLATVAPEKLASQELDTSVGVSGPHAFSVRKKAPSSLAPLASTASPPPPPEKNPLVFCAPPVPPHPPNVRDDRETPLETRRDGRHIRLIWVGLQA